MEWTNDIVLEFLEIYQEESVIWDPKHPQHRDRHLVHDGWKRIETRMGGSCNVRELKKKKDTLMATFRKLWKTVQASRAETDEVFKPDWFAYDYMNKFLQGVYTPKTTNSEITEDTERLKVEMDETSVSEFQNDQQSERTIKQPGIDQLVDTKVKKTSSRVSKKRKRKQENSEDVIIEEAPTISPNSTQTNSSPHPDYCMVYGQYVGNKLRTYNKRTQSFVEHAINSILFDADMGKYHSKT